LDERRLSLERLARADRLVAAAGLLFVSGLAWLELLRLLAAMRHDAAAGMAGMAMGAVREWSATDAVGLFGMWSVMMAAMMLPSAAPMILLFAAVERGRRERSASTAPTAAFAAGYLLVWCGFSAAAALTQTALHQASLLSPAMVSTTPFLSGALLLTAGLWQWLPVKQACLHHCRSPVHFFQHEWREGTAGAVRMGVGHGVYCLGCCWALMVLLFVGGVMNLLVVAAIAGLVLVEKVARAGPWIGRIAGLGLAGWGGWMLVAAAAGRG
jgi:predicted metal-binding membrane protein